MMKYILSLSYGKDSLACLGAIEQLGWPLDRIIHAEVWATDTIPADLPPMVEFKAKADKIIKERWGIQVEHVSSDVTFEQGFYFKRGRTGRKTKFDGKMYGWPMQRGQWCLQQLKLPALNKISKNSIQYIGIAADEPNRFGVLSEKRKVRLLRLDGMKHSAGSGVKKITYFLQFTPAQPVEVAGSATIRVLTN